MNLPQRGPVPIVLMFLVFVLTLRDIEDGVARHIPGFPDYKRKDSPVNFWFVCIVRLVFAVAGLAYSIYNTIYGKE